MGSVFKHNMLKVIDNCKRLKSFVSSWAELITYDYCNNNFSPKNEVRVDQCMEIFGFKLLRR